MSNRRFDQDAIVTEHLPVLGFVPASVERGKRALDIAVALLALVLTAPLWPLIALAIKLDSPGPVIFRQCVSAGCTRTARRCSKC